MTMQNIGSRAAALALATLLAMAPWAPSKAQADAAAMESGRLEPAPRARLLDLDDPLQQRAYRDHLRHAGVAADSPLYQWTGAGQRRAGMNLGSRNESSRNQATRNQVLTLLGFGSDDAGKTVSSGALYVSDDDVYKITLTLMVTGPGGAVVASGTTEVTESPSAVVNVSGGENPEQRPLNALATASVLYSDGSHDVYYASGDVAGYPTRVENQAPALNAAAPDNTDVQVCINRATAAGAPAPACNFVLAAIDSPPPLQLPVAGSAVFDGDIDVDGSGKPSNASATLVMLAPDGTASCRIAQLDDAFFDDPGTRVEGDTLSWSFDPLRFDNGCAIATGAYDFSLVVSVRVQGRPAWATVSSQIDEDTITAREIPPVQVVAGCIAKGTRVTLASGVARAVEQLKAGDRVQSEGGDLEIAAIASGMREASVTLTLAGGQSVQVSTIHAIPTQRGIVQAQELRLGDELTTSSGTSPVTRIVAEVLPEPLQVYDLVLTPARVSPKQGSTYFAGGILVGDGAMKAALAEAKAEAKEQHP